MKLSNILNGTTDSSQAENTHSPPVYLDTQGFQLIIKRMEKSLHAQVNELHLFAKKMGIQLAEVYEESGWAYGNESNHPKFVEMFSRTKSNPDIFGILAHDISRSNSDPFLGPLVKGS